MPGRRLGPGQMTEQERVDQARYIELAISGERRKVPPLARHKREKLPNPTRWT